jgi:hypothetical protein
MLDQLCQAGASSAGIADLHAEQLFSTILSRGLHQRITEWLVQWIAAVRCRS